MDKQKIIEFFNHHAPHWDAQLETDDGKMNEIMDAAGIRAGAAVLDIACGTGVMFPYYLGRGAARITGVDIAPKMAEAADAKFRGEERIEVRCADAETEVFRTEYDCCMVFNAFPHFGHPKALLLNLYHALKDGGTLTVAHDSGRAALDRRHKDSAGEVSVRLMHEEQLAALFEECGFREILCRATDGIYIVSGKKYERVKG